MKLFFLLIFLLPAVACQTHNKPPEEKIATPTGSFTSDTTIVTKNQSVRVKAWEINLGQVVLAATINGQVALQDTISSHGLLQPAYPDFNNDGNPDILLSYSANKTTNFLYLFDAGTRKFVSVDNFMNFPGAVQLKANRTYYYSYYPEGCNDLNWVSDLFKIEDFQATKIGHIYGKGCELNVLENPKFIGVYKIDPKDSQTESMIEKLPYQASIPTNDDKLVFIEKYWNSHYNKFE